MNPPQLPRDLILHARGVKSAPCLRMHNAWRGNQTSPPLYTSRSPPLATGMRHGGPGSGDTQGLQRRPRTGFGNLGQRWSLSHCLSLFLSVCFSLSQSLSFNLLCVSLSFPLSIPVSLETPSSLSSHLPLHSSFLCLNILFTCLPLYVALSPVSLALCLSSSVHNFSCADFSIWMRL